MVKTTKPRGKPKDSPIASVRKRRTKAPVEPVLGKPENATPEEYEEKLGFITAIGNDYTNTIQQWLEQAPQKFGTTPEVILSALAHRMNLETMLHVFNIVPKHKDAKEHDDD